MVSRWFPGGLPAVSCIMGSAGGLPLVSSLEFCHWWSRSSPRVSWWSCSAWFITVRDLCWHKSYKDWCEGKLLKALRICPSLKDSSSPASSFHVRLRDDRQAQLYTCAFQASDSDVLWLACIRDDGSEAGSNRIAREVTSC